MNKENWLLSALSVIAVASFTFPFIAIDLHNVVLGETETTIEINLEKTEKSSGNITHDTDDLSEVYEIITFGIKSMHNIIEYTNIAPSDLFVLVNQEIEILQNQYILPKTQFRLLDTPTLLTYKREDNSVIVWEYYFSDETGNVLKFLFHPNSGKILWLDYENVKIAKDNDWIVEYHTPYIDEENVFNYTGTRLLAILETPPEIYKTQIRLFQTGYAVTVHKK